MHTHVDISNAALEQIEFHKVREFTAGFARGEEGKARLLNLHPGTDLDEIRGRMDEVHEYMEIASRPSRLQLGVYRNVSESIQRLSVEGYVLPQEDIHEIGGQLEQVAEVHRYFEKSELRREYAAVAQWTNWVADPRKMVTMIRRILDEKGDVRPDASPALLQIARAKDAETSRLNREFAKLISKYKQDGILSDTPESIRSGRRVLSVQAEHKRQIRGIIHDESTTGRTVFIEPELIVEINNNLIELEAEYKKEIYRLLKELCLALRPDQELIENASRLLPHWDVIQALSAAGSSYKGIRVKWEEGGMLHLVRAFHPLLYLQHKNKGKSVIPFDLMLHPANRLLVLSGPNAGGKSILLKATGLLQVMAQCGMMVPVDGATIMGVMNRIAVDIGDQQSIEEDLSTYSSRLANMKRTLEKADEATLILIDEFGSGTDPKTGGAIAEAILNAFVRRKSFGVVTTHYPNIKMYAHRTKGVVNGAMMFDKEKIVPTYQLKIGKPGSSFAFEIAERTGLPEDVIEYARKRAGTQTMELEDLIHDLDSKTTTLDREKAKMDEKQRELDRLISNYEQLRLDLEIKRKKFRVDQKKANLNEVTSFSIEMNKLMKDLRKEKDEEKIRQQVEKIKAKQAEAMQEIKSISESLSVVQGGDRKYVAGDHVKLVSTQQIGVVERVEKDNLVISIGQLTMTLPKTEVTPSQAPVEINKHRSIQSDVVDYSKFQNELDIRGMLPEEATRFLERFIDAAFMSRVESIRIVHGKGTGTLRHLVARVMKSYPFKSIRHPEKKEGGDGVTLGDL